MITGIEVVRLQCNSICEEAFGEGGSPCRGFQGKVPHLSHLILGWIEIMVMR